MHRNENAGRVKLVSSAVSYAANDNCVVHKDAGITQENAKDLEGKTVATPIGNVTHYKLLRTLDHLGVDASAECRESHILLLKRRNAEPS